MASFRGASAGQDGRFTNKEKKLLRTMSFPEVLDRAVDFKKVKLESLRPWIAKRVTEVLGLEDEVVENDTAKPIMEHFGMQFPSVEDL